MAKHGKKYLAALAKVDRSQVLRSRARRWHWSRKPAYHQVRCHGRSSHAHGSGSAPGRPAWCVMWSCCPMVWARRCACWYSAQGEGAAQAREAGADFVADSDEWISQDPGRLDRFRCGHCHPGYDGQSRPPGSCPRPAWFDAEPQGWHGCRREDLPRVINEAKAGRVEFRLDKTANLHVPIGKVSFDAAEAVREPGCADGSDQERRAHRLPRVFISGVSP